MTERFLDLLFAICILLLAFADNSKSQQTCPPPDYPVGGNYTPRLNKFQPGDEITYSCERTYTLMGKDSSKCKSNGDWSNFSPFCDRKATLKTPYALLTNGVRKLNPSVIDGSPSTCFSLKTGEKQVVSMEKNGAVYAVRLFLGSGAVNIEIYYDKVRCIESYVKYFETSQWVLIKCKNSDELTNSVTIQDKSPRNNNSTICEIEIFVKEDDGCEKPPDRKIVNGHLKVSRTKAILICEPGYRSNYSRLVCEGNDWKGSRLICDEILCSPELNFTRSAGSEWYFLDAVKKISAGTRRKLRCSSGYEETGGPNIIVCQKNGTWTETNAKCIEKVKPKVSTQTIIFAAVGTAVVVIIIVLLATTIYFVKKQRNKQVIVVYKQPTEGSMISGSEGDYSSAYYETIQNIAPLPPATSRPTAQILSEGYFSPLDRKDTLKKRQPMPADIAFGTLKQSTLYGC